MLKRGDLNKEELKSYRPVSNLLFLAKFLERIASAQLEAHLDEINLRCPLQSAYKKYHSAETATLKIHNDIAENLDSGKNVGLIQQDLSAAFDTVDHEILLLKLKKEFNITDNALQWFKSYLTGRSQKLCIKNV